MAPSGETFAGKELLEAALDKDLRYGSQKIFHRHERKNGAGKVLFGMINSVNPGIFKLNEMDEFSTPGVSFFMLVKDSDDPMAALETMLATADGMREVLGGELKDGERNPLTHQTTEHYRQRIMDYNRRQLAG